MGFEFRTEQLGFEFHSQEKHDFLMERGRKTLEENNFTLEKYKNGSYMDSKTQIHWPRSHLRRIWRNCEHVSRTGCHSLVKRTIRILRSIEAVFVGKKMLTSIIHFWAEFKFDFFKTNSECLTNISSW